MTNKVHDAATSCLSALGVVFSLEDISSVLNLILLIVSILNLIIMLFFKIKNALKDGKIDKDEAKDIANTVEEITDVIDRNSRT